MAGEEEPNSGRAPVGPAVGPALLRGVDDRIREAEAVDGVPDALSREKGLVGRGSESGRALYADLEWQGSEVRGRKPLARTRSRAL